MKNLFVFLSLARWARVDARLRRNEVLGRAWAPLPRFVGFVGWWFSKWNYNNIMLHARGIDSNTAVVPARDGGTFNFSRFAERRVIQETARYMGLGHIPLTGYITTGATEANLFALWVAREWAIKNRPPRTHWIIPKSAHYSIDKALSILGILTGEMHVVHRVSIEKDGSTSWDELRKVFDSLQDTQEPIVCVLTAMTTEFGLIDPIAELNKYLEVRALENVYLHVDAAFSAFVLPFLPEYRSFFSSLTRVNSWSVDYHKVLGGPTASGAVMFMPGLETYAAVPATYLSDSADYTVTGSRKGIDAVMLLALCMSTSRSVLERRTALARTKTMGLYTALSKLGTVRPLYEPFANYLIIEIVSDTEERAVQVEQVLSKYAITATRVSVGGVTQKLYKIILRHDTPTSVLSDCLKKLQAVE